MSEASQTALHNKHVPEVLWFLARPQIEGQTSMAGTLVILESVILGTLLLAEQHGKDPRLVLDAIYHAVQSRLEAEMRDRDV